LQCFLLHNSAFNTLIYNNKNSAFFAGLTVKTQQWMAKRRSPFTKRKGWSSLHEAVCLWNYIASISSTSWSV